MREIFIALLILSLVGQFVGGICFIVSAIILKNL